MSSERIILQKAEKMTPLEIVGLVVTFLTALGGLISSLSNRRSARVSDTRTEAEAKKTHVDAQSVVIKDLCADLDRLSKRLDEVEEDNAALRKLNDDLAKRVTQLERDNTLLERKYNHVLDWATPKGYQPPSW